MLLLLLAPWLASVDSPGAAVVHAERPGSDWEADVTVVTMECGAACSIGDDGIPSPVLDFFGPTCAWRSNCDPCLLAMAVRVVN